MSHEKFNVAEAEAVENVEGNMLCTAMRGVTALPWSETPLRTKGKRRNLGDLSSPIPASAVLGRDGKSGRRNRRGRGEESDGCIVPGMPRTKLVGTSGGDGGGKAADRREGEQRHTPRAQNRNRHVTEAVNLRIVGVQNRDHVRPSIGARCGKAARRDLCGGTGVTRFPTASGISRNSPKCPAIYCLFRELTDTPVGYVWFGDASGMSKATGTMDLQSGRFHLTLTPLDGDGPTGEVTGVKERFTETVTAELQGPGCSKLKLGPMKPFVRKADGTD